MKNIFEENRRVGKVQTAWTDFCAGSSPKVRRETHFVYATIEAHFDRGTRTLVIDLNAHGNSEYNTFLRMERRIFETQPTREDALRSVVAHADEWYAEVQTTIPAGDASLSDDEVIERSKAKRITDEVPF